MSYFVLLAWYTLTSPSARSCCLTEIKHASYLLLGFPVRTFSRTAVSDSLLKIEILVSSILDFLACFNFLNHSSTSSACFSLLDSCYHLAWDRESETGIQNGGSGSVKPDVDAPSSLV